ncbi:proteophosphoglycan 5 [Grosmannia clavigera kw1407]|uniref:Proteophosphoglycan 5 n=1 Tax=Grosmannia clavigera (strain kw1407 / UAMH 11150) TaxID=655863 RepID=F0XPQ4_GROCL|nr:proteophosphoglycan 5 [Grosmannia clavigera kw1407]EFX00113.1 proteophosphoglycan 5 [Grosmannia clavigera kw1407]
MPEPANSNVKQTPGRRRPGPNAARPSSKKNYASENDAAAAEPNFHPDFGQRRHGPQTPKKGTPKSPAPNAQPTPAKSNRRNGNKNYPKNISTSPGPAKPGRRTPPQTAGAKPTSASAATTAFAGATFHASPAPSSLPLPSFFMKPNSPDTPRVKSANGVGQEPSPPPSDSEQLSEQLRDRFLETSVPGHESPLDIFFRADRAEKAHRASTANIFNGPSVPYSPPAQAQTLPDKNSYTFPRNSQHPLRRPLHARNPSSGISAAELDSNSSQPIGPAFATPFQERMRAVRPSESNSPVAKGSIGFRDLPASAASPGDLQQSRGTTSHSEALKQYLFSKTALSASGPTTFGNSPGLTSSPAMAARHTRGPSSGAIASRTTSFAPIAFQNIYATPSARMMPGSNNEPANLAAMENTLRQVLKLGAPSGATPAGNTCRN